MRTAGADGSDALVGMHEAARIFPLDHWIYGTPAEVCATYACDPVGALQEIERALKRDPYNGQLHKTRLMYLEIVQARGTEIAVTQLLARWPNSQIVQQIAQNWYGKGPSPSPTNITQ